MATKKPDAMPLERIILTKGHERNLSIERNSATRDKAMLAALDAELQRNAVENLAHKGRQREKAAKPRKVGTDGRTMRELIAAEALSHHGLTPLELLPHVNSAAIANGMKPITLKTLRNKLACK